MKKNLILSLLLLASATLQAEIKTPAVIGDHMVLQRNTQARLWGWSSPNSHMTVETSWGDQTYRTTADEKGRWEIAVQTGDATFEAQNIVICEYKPSEYRAGRAAIRYQSELQLFDRITINDILIGEVWLASGQSNMQMPLKGFPGAAILNGQADATNAFRENPGVRMMVVELDQKLEEQETCQGEWTTARFPNPMNWSATAYYFASALSQSLQIPVGIVTSAYGGATVESWTSRDVLKQYEDRVYILNNIDRAIENKWIQVYYQPMVRTSNDKVCTEEALARWIDPQKGMIPPLSFIPILEDYKISYKLDLYVVEQVCKKLNAQRDYGMFVVPNTINLSRTDFYVCDMVKEIKKRVDAAGIDHNLIIIEITESILIDDLDYMKIQIDRFHKEGFTVWMDDFGSGYSSPSILQDIPFDAIKIDKLFIDNITTNENSRILVNEFVRLFTGLQCESVAEGVETIEQVNFLKEIGCSQLQGYYYHKPVPYSVLCELFDTKHPLTYENPSETEYYSKVGAVNLYDVSNASLGAFDGLQHYFDTIPMFIGEAGEQGLRLIRGNKSFRDFMNHYYPKLYRAGFLPYSGTMDVGYEFTSAIKNCKENGSQIVVDVQTERGAVIHVFIRRIATNPETAAVALAIVILGYVEKNSELKQKQELDLIHQERKAYRRITALAGDYICLYTVDPKTDHFIEFSATRAFQNIGVPVEGENFFGQSIKRSSKAVFIEDQDLYLSMFSKEKVLKEIESKGIFTLNYRLMLDGVPKHVCLKAALIDEESGQQLIVGLLDTDAQVKKDMEYNRKLMAARDIANLDTLTGLKNKHAYVDLESHLNVLIEEKSVPDFAIIVFDINDLKKINDTRGHQAGDQYIKDGCRRICNAFKHSPVFRIGGDEFVAIAQGDDYKNVDELFKEFRETNEKNVGTGAVVIASGMKKRHNEKNVAAVFEKADKEMYKNKKHLKGQT